MYGISSRKLEKDPKMLTEVNHFIPSATSTPKVFQNNVKQKQRMKSLQRNKAVPDSKTRTGLFNPDPYKLNTTESLTSKLLLPQNECSPRFSCGWKPKLCYTPKLECKRVEIVSSDEEDKAEEPEKLSLKKSNSTTNSKSKCHTLISFKPLEIVSSSDEENIPKVKQNTTRKYARKKMNDTQSKEILKKFKPDDIEADVNVEDERSSKKLIDKKKNIRAFKFSDVAGWQKFGDTEGIFYTKLFSNSHFEQGYLKFSPLMIYNSSSNTDLVLTVCSGRCRILSVNDKWLAQTGDVVHIPQKTDYKIENTGRKNDLVLLYCRAYL